MLSLQRSLGRSVVVDSDEGLVFSVPAVRAGVYKLLADVSRDPGIFLLNLWNSPRNRTTI